MWLFKRKPKPEIGDIYIDNNDNPFTPDYKLEIVDVKDGWVEYVYHHKFGDEFRRSNNKYSMSSRHLKWLYAKSK